MNLKSVYVTVGTTKFDDLIEQIFSDEVLASLQSRGCKKLVIQYGNGNVPPVENARNYNIEVETYQFKFEPQRVDIIESDLTIGHAGAGTCMDILKENKPGLVVINESLMDNHQAELAEQLAKDGYIFQSNLGSLAENLASIEVEELVPYEKGKGMPAFITHLKELLGAV